MLETLMFIQGKNISKDSAITFKTSGTEATTIITSELGYGFTTEYSIDGSPLTPAGDSIDIPAGDHEVTLKLTVTTGTLLNMIQFKDILTEVVDWEDFQLPNIKFFSCTKLTKVPDYLPPVITNMHFMFYNCSSFNQDISGWDTSNVTDMRYMFCDCTSFNQDIGNWDTSNVTNMSYMFYGCTSFNQDISQWDVHNVTNISHMFRDCTSFNQDLSSMVFKSTVNRNSYDSGATAWDPAYRPQFTG